MFISEEVKNFPYGGKVMLTQNLMVDADTNREGLVSKAYLSKLINMADTIPWMYRFAPPDVELYKTSVCEDC